MAVKWVRQKKQRQWSKTREGKRGQRVYLVQCGPADGPEIAAAACPAYGTPWSPAEPLLLVNDISADETENASGLFVVTVQYETPELGDTGQDGNAEENPILRAPQVSLHFEKFTETAYVDAMGQSIINSAGMTFDPSVELEYDDPVVTVSKNVLGVDLLLLMDGNGTTNSDHFTITYRGKPIHFAPGQALLRSIRTESQVEQGIEFDTVRWDLIFRRDGWKIKVLDQGLFERSATGLRPIRDDNGDPITEPHPLDGAGKKLAKDKPLVFLEFEPRRKLRFGDFNLDS